MSRSQGWKGILVCLALVVKIMRADAEVPSCAVRIAEDDAVPTGLSWLPPTSPRLMLQEPSGTADLSPRSIIDVMVLFTGAAKDYWGIDEVRDRILLSIAYLNEACNRSGVQTRFRLVYAAETTWHTETAWAADELCWLAQDEKVQELREKVGADLVSLFVLNGRPTGGIARLPGSFSVFNGTPYVFAHECGHNLGCAHDRANAESYCDAEGCSFGYSFIPPGCSAIYGDLMSYVGSQIEQFSNPSLYFLGAPTGIPEGHRNAAGQPDAADNALTLNRASPYVAAARDSGTTVLESPLLSENGSRFEFQICGPAVGECTIECSTDGQAWVPLSAHSLIGESAVVNDAVSQERCRFYRARMAAGLLPVQVGFVKCEVPAGLSMIANPLEAPANTIGALLRSVPDGTVVYKWIEGRQTWVCNAFTIDSWDDPAMTLHPGEGLVLRNPGQAFTLQWTGELNAALHSRIPLNLSMRSSAVAQGGPLQSRLGYSPCDAGSQVMRMTSPQGGYTTYTWDGQSWQPTEPNIRLGESFWTWNPVNAFIWQHVPRRSGE